MAEDCLFCKIAAGGIPSTPVYTDDAFYAFRDINPGAPTHVLVIPRRHIASVADAGPEDADLLGRLLLIGNKVAEQEGLVDSGYRFVINAGPGAGQTVFHIHLHVLGGRQMSWPPG
jgi:histidine triad (HIT) family protein